MGKRVTVIPAKATGQVKTEATKKKLRVAAYCRVSTEQEEQQGSFKNQVDYYTSLIGNHPDYELAGIFADEGISGTGTRKRPGFMAMIRACDEGSVDFLITKSISRFARNTADCLHFARHLKNKGILILFEKEGINTLEASGELLFTILSSLAQEESRNISENTQWGIRSKFRQGIPQINTVSLLGYDKDENGNLVINEEQAEVVRRIYREFLDGWSISEISRRLNADRIPGVHGKANWYPISIRRILKNEKHVGDLLMQKTYTSDFLIRKMEKNKGEVEQYFIKDNHPAIIKREDWEAVQLEMDRRERFQKRHGIKNLGSPTYDRFFSKVFCGNCGGKYTRHYYRGIREAYWRCETCKTGRVMEFSLKKAVADAWNTLVDHREEYLPDWERTAAQGDAMERYYSRLMITATAEGLLEAEQPEFTRLFLEEIKVISLEVLEVKFLTSHCLQPIRVVR